MTEQLPVLQIIVAVVVLVGQALGVSAYINRVIREERTAWTKATEMLHARLNDIRKEYVPDAVYQRELAETKQGQREILAAIHRVGEQVSARIGKLEQVSAVQDYRIQSLDDKSNGRNVSRASQPVT